MTRPITILFAVLLVFAACSSADPEPANPVTTAGTVADVQAPNEPAEEDVQPPDDPGTEGESPVPEDDPARAGTATVTLENGEVFEFSVRCGLEPIDSGQAGRELLFSVDSYDDSLYTLTVTHYGPDKYGSRPMSLIQIWSISNNEIAWGAYSGGGGEIALTLDGATVRGSAVFGAGGDTANPGVRGELVASC